MVAESTEREAIRAELAATRAAFHQLLADLSETDWRRKTPNPKWTVGDLLHHLVWSLEVLPREVASARRGQGMYNFPPFLGGPLSTLVIRLGARNQSLRTIARRYEAAYSAVLSALDAVRDDEWQRGAPFWGEGFFNIAGLFRAQAHHFAEHSQDIRAALPRDAAATVLPGRSQQGNA